MQLFLIKYYKIKVYKGKDPQEDLPLYYNLNLSILENELRHTFKHFEFNKYKVNILINKIFNNNKKNKILKKIYKIIKEKNVLESQIFNKQDTKLKNIKINYISKLLLNYLNKIIIDINYKFYESKITLNDNNIMSYNKNFLDQINVITIFSNLQLKKFTLVTKNNNSKKKKCIKADSLSIS